MELGVYRASQVGTCGRLQQYRALGYSAEKESPELIVGIFNDGNMHHDETRRLMGEVGTLTHVEQGLTKLYKYKGESFRITGHIDGKWNGKLFDIKSIGTYGFKSLNKNFPEDYMHYIYQITIYMDMLGDKEAMFVFKDKNTGELRVIEVEFDKDVLKKALQKVYEVHVGIKENLNIEDKKKHKLIIQPYSPSHYYCKGCVFRQHCRNQPMEGRTWSE